MRGLSGIDRVFSGLERGFDAFTNTLIESFDASAEHGYIASWGQIEVQCVECEPEGSYGDTLWSNHPSDKVFMIDPAEGQFVVRGFFAGEKCEGVEPAGGGFVLAVELELPRLHAAS